jgi:rhodanese-related sulfurtransferase
MPKGEFMPDHKLPKTGSLLTVALLVLVGAGVMLYKTTETVVTDPVAKPASSGIKTAKPLAAPLGAAIRTPQLPEAITPEGVKALTGGNTPYILVNADDPKQQVQSPGPVRLIYYTMTPSSRSAQKLVEQDRQTAPTGLSDALKAESQRLTGTPVEWQRLGLPITSNPQSAQAQTLTPKLLSEAIKDSVDLQVIDLRPVIPGETEASPFPNALRWMPHEVISNIPQLSKEKWIVLVGLASEDAKPIAFELFQKGFVLTTVLDGGYPAWVNAVDR